MDAILKNTFQNALAGYKLVADYTVSGSAISSYDFIDLNITKEDDYILVSDVVNAGSGGLSFYLFANGNNTTSNYYSQILWASSTSLSSLRANFPYYADTDGSGKNLNITNIKLTNNGYYVAQSSNTKTYGGSAIIKGSFYLTSTFTATSITSLRVQSNVSNAIGINSRFQLYKRVAPIIADITVSSAKTSVDITGLSIDKDSEYMLVSDVVNSTGSGSEYYLYSNGNTTNSNYYRQNIYVDGSAYVPARTNDASYLYSFASAKSFGISNIKLTNNGYITWQNNDIVKYGTSSMTMLIEYNTSTFTATSITQLTITASATNAIGAGSRFQLIKLK